MSKKRSEYVGDFLTIDYEVPLRQRIADLEAKLAESEKNYAELFCRNTELETLYSQKTALLNFYKDTDLVKENTELKQQLAEKEKEIEDYQKMINDICNKYRVCSLKELPISVAVEKLERVKEKLEDDRNNAQALLDPNEYEEYQELIGVVRGYRNSIYEVQKLITEIKEGK